MISQVVAVDDLAGLGNLAHTAGGQFDRAGDTANGARRPAHWRGRGHWAWQHLGHGAAHAAEWLGAWPRLGAKARRRGGSLPPGAALVCQIEHLVGLDAQHPQAPGLIELCLRSALLTVQHIADHLAAGILLRQAEVFFTIGDQVSDQRIGLKDLIPLICGARAEANSDRDLVCSHIAISVPDCQKLRLRSRGSGS